jgi:hypothetical protein
MGDPDDIMMMDNMGSPRNAFYQQPTDFFAPHLGAYK